MLPNRFVYLDTEATGTSPSHSRITDVAVILVEGSEEIDRWQTLINPGVAIPPTIVRLTGITPLQPPAKIVRL